MCIQECEFNGAYRNLKLIWYEYEMADEVTYVNLFNTQPPKTVISYWSLLELDLDELSVNFIT